jgi:hypothetical protein
MNLVNLSILDLCVLFGTYLELQVKVCYDSNWSRNKKSQVFQPYMVGQVIYPDKREQHVWSQNWNLLRMCRNWRFGLHGGILTWRLCLYYPILFIYLMLNNCFNLCLFWPIRYYLGVYFIIELMLVDY